MQEGVTLPTLDILVPIEDTSDLVDNLYPEPENDNPDLLPGLPDNDHRVIIPVPYTQEDNENESIDDLIPVEERVPIEDKVPLIPISEGSEEEESIQEEEQYT